MSYFSKNIKLLRENKKITQAALGEIVGVKPNTISNYENHVSEPDFDTLIAISKYFDVNIHDLLTTDLENIKFETKKGRAKQSDFVEENVELNVELNQKNAGFSIASDVQPKYLAGVPPDALDRSRLFPVTDDRMLPALPKGVFVLAYKVDKTELIINKIGVVETLDNTIIGSISMDRESGFFIVAFEDPSAPPKLVKMDDVQKTWIALMKCTLIGK